MESLGQKVFCLGWDAMEGVSAEGERCVDITIQRRLKIPQFPSTA